MTFCNNGHNTYCYDHSLLDTMLDHFLLVLLIHYCDLRGMMLVNFAVVEIGML
jgi:hypothetical protein